MELITECVVLEAIPPDRVNRENGVVQGVRVLGSKSKNNRRYTEQVMRDSVSLYEGCPVKLNHRDISSKRSDRPVQEGFGMLKGARLHEGAIYADHHFPPNHDYAATYCDYCTLFERKIGFSHDAEGETHMDEGVQIVDSLAVVHSVDLVDAPATNVGLYESEQRTMAAKKTRTVKDIAEAAKAESPERERLMEAMDAGIISPDLEVPAGAEGETEQDSLKAALASAVMAVFNDDTKDAKETKKAIAKIIDMGEVVNGGGKKEEELDEDTDETEEEDVPAMESLQHEIKDLRADQAVRRLLETKEYKALDVDEDLVETLKVLNEKQRLALLGRLTTNTKTSSRPVRSAPIRESRGNPSNSQFDTALERARARKSA